ncbi:MAG TPA: emopamil-binding family protein [Ktedonobacterales bacterium]|jgi:hypothetical protein|nr:emopamil-binding family protein [Ktedonobacterales bacterium]
MGRRPIPLTQRPWDSAFLAFFLVNLCFITYIVDLEQLVIANPAHFTYPLWPPAPLVDLVHRYARAYDPLVLARPLWWKMTIWFDALGFGPFYAASIYAWSRGRDWIRLPSLLYGASIITIVCIILSEEYGGPHATPHFPIVLLLNLPWIIFPALIIARMWRSEHPFTRAAVEESAPDAATQAVSRTDNGKAKR